MELHYVERGAGTAGRSPVVLLHGFPGFWYCWRHQLPALGAAGFRAVAPDLRGYNRSPKPPRVCDYGIERLAEDVLGLVRRVAGPGGRASVVGHDWGGIVAWWLAMHHPDVVERLVILNAPHPAAYLREVKKPAQLLRSWYAFFFQLPWLPEAAIRFNDFAALRRMFRTDPARAGAFSTADIDQYVKAFAPRGALTAAINYYRAAFRDGQAKTGQSIRPIHLPTLLVWGERDRYLVPGLTHDLGRWVTDLRVERLPRASHWVQHDEPQRVTQLLIDFLAANAGR